MKLLPLLLVLVVAPATAVAAGPLPAGHPAPGGAKAGSAAPEATLPQKGKVVSTIAAPPYIYIEVMQDKKTQWLAANAIPTKKGDVIRFDNGMVMSNFHSKSLNRTFPSVLFVNRVVVTKEKE